MKFSRGLLVGLGPQLFPALGGSTLLLSFMPFQAIIRRMSGGLDAVMSSHLDSPREKFTSGIIAQFFSECE